MSDHTKAARAKAEAEFQKVQTQARERERQVSERDAQAREVEDNSARLKALRLARDAAESDSGSGAEKAMASRADRAGSPRGAPAPADPKASRWGDLNKALNGLVKEGVIDGYTTGKVAKGDVPPVEVTIKAGADQADVVRRVRESLPPDLADAKIRTRADG